MRRILVLRVLLLLVTHDGTYGTNYCRTYGVRWGVEERGMVGRSAEIEVETVADGVVHFVPVLMHERKLVQKVTHRLTGIREREQ